MPIPTVSVIIPVYNVRTWLAECVASIRRQSLGADRIEVIAVDDRSTDGSWEELEEIAATFPQLTALRLPTNSGGPGAPRNRGLDQATGRYVFFLDADDYLGDEALERMVAMAERASSDVVLGRIATPPGHRDRAPRSMFHRSVEHADLYTSNVFNSLGPWKLFRRDLIESHRIRFPEGVARREDGPFTSRCYLNARAISVVADYDCYYLRTRPDGSNATTQRPDYPALVEVAADLVRIVTDHVPPGDGRDHLIRRHARTAILTLFSSYWLRTLSAEEQRDSLKRAQAVLGDCLTEGVLARLEPHERLQLHLIRTGRWDAFIETLPTLLTDLPSAVVVDGRAYQPLAFFGDPRMKVPDSVYDATDRLRVTHTLTALEWSPAGLNIRGQATIPIKGTPTIDLLLQRRSTREDVLVPTTQYATNDEFSALIEPATAWNGRPLSNGIWDVWISVTVDGLSKRQRLGPVRAEGVPAEMSSHEVSRPGGPVVATSYFTASGNLSIDLGEYANSAFPSPRLVTRHSSALSLRVVVDCPRPDDDRHIAAELVLTHGKTRKGLPTTVTIGPDGVRLTGRLRLPGLRLRPGTWGLRTELRTGDLRRDVPVHDARGKAVRISVLPRLKALAARLRGRS